MFVNAPENGRKNLCGEVLKKYRKKNGLTQEQMTARLQQGGFDMGKNMYQRVEDGSRHVPDFELSAISTVLGIPLSELLSL